MSWVIVPATCFSNDGVDFLFFYGVDLHVFRENYLILRSQKLKNENIFTGKNISVLFVVIC